MGRIIKTRCFATDQDNKFIIYKNDTKLATASTKTEAFQIVNKLKQMGHSGLEIRTSKEIVMNDDF